MIEKISYLLPPKLSIQFDYFRFNKKIPQIDKPITFQDKMQWIKLYGNLYKYYYLCDKFLIRKFVAQRIGEEYLVPLIDVFDDPNQISFNKLPNEFVLKATHGSKMNIIVKDKNKLNTEEIRGRLNQWLQTDFSRITKEPQYENCTRKIICEKYIEDWSGGLIDYKFFCYEGVPRFVQVDYDRYGEHERNYYDISWNQLPVTVTYPNLSINFEKPTSFDRLKDLARLLSKDIPFVRVDLYAIYDQVYFGELTFVPGGGFECFKPEDFNYIFGEDIDIQKYRS